MKKVLIITYYWPPSGGPGVQRVLNFVKHLPSHGWQPTILTVKNGEYPAIDESLSNEIPQNCKVFKTNAFEPNILYKKFTNKPLNQPLPVAAVSKKGSNWKESLARWIRLNTFVPDAKIGWIPFAVSAGKKIIKDMEPDLILSSSPPHTVHIIAKKLAKWSSIPWIADFRDPWTMIYHYDNTNRLKMIQKFEKNLEQNVLLNADHLSTVSNNIRDILDTNKRCITKFSIISNGFDDEKAQLIKDTPKTPKFTIAYAGKMNHQQNALMLWEAIDQLLEKSHTFHTDLEIKFMGHIANDMLVELKKYNFFNKIQFLGYKNHLEMLQTLKQSSILLLLIANTQHNKGILSGKIFDYLSTQNYILGFGPADGEAAQILKDTKCGQMFNYENNIFTFFENLYLSWKNSDLHTPDISKISQYSRKNQTAQLAQIMESLI